MSNTIGRAKILTAPCIFFKKRYAAPVREDFRGGFRGGFSGQGGGKEGRGRRDGAGGTGQDEPQARTERDKADESGRDRAAAGRQKLAERGRGSRNGETKKTGETGKTGKAGKCWKMLENAGKCWKKLENRTGVCREDGAEERGGNAIRR